MPKHLIAAPNYEMIDRIFKDLFSEGGKSRYSQIISQSVRQHPNLIPYKALPCLQGQAGPLEKWPHTMRS